MTGRMHGVAIDAGSGLAEAIGKARGQDAGPDDLFEFKRAVLRTLGPGASTVLLDAQAGPRLLDDYPENCAAMLALEADVTHISDVDRITILPDNLAVSDFPDLGVRQLKFFMYYAPDDRPELNARKQAIIAEIGAACRARRIAFLFEPLVYHPTVRIGCPEFAALKPSLVARAAETFADPRFHASVLKLEIPVDLSFVEGFGAPEMTRADVHEAFRAVSRAACDVPIVFLSAGVPFERFEASLVLAREAGLDFHGFMCGRAIWSDAVAVFGREGASGMQDWLAGPGRTRLGRLIDVLG